MATEITTMRNWLNTPTKPAELKPTLKLLAQVPQRLTLPELIDKAQEAKDEAEQPKTWVVPKWFDGSDAEYDSLQKYYWLERFKAVMAEVDRRAAFQARGVAQTNKEVISAIKEAVRIEDIVEQYVELFKTGQNYKYRCELHGDGQDRDASGYIYVAEQRYQCFGCNKGGDVLDFLVAYGRLTMPQAIKKLAEHCGIDTKPVKPVRIKGGIDL